MFSAYFATTLREANAEPGASISWRAWEANSAVNSSCLWLRLCRAGPRRLNRFAKNLARNARFPAIALRGRQERVRQVRGGVGFTCPKRVSGFGEMARIAFFSAFASSRLRCSTAASRFIRLVRVVLFQPALAWCGRRASCAISGK